LTEIGEAERTTAPITVAPIKANVRIVISPKFATQATKTIATHCEVGLIQIKFYRPNWFMRRSSVALSRCNRLRHTRQGKTTSGSALFRFRNNARRRLGRVLCLLDYPVPVVRKGKPRFAWLRFVQRKWGTSRYSGTMKWRYRLRTRSRSQ
jgi:hypothetical protein